MSTNADVETGGVGPSPEIPEPSGALKPITMMTPLEMVTGLGAASAVISSVLAMIVTLGNPFVVLGGVFGSAMGPFMYYQQTQLTDIQALQETHEAFAAQLNDLNESNERLKHEIDELKGTVKGLEDVEEALDVITNMQGQSVAAFEEQVEEQRGILQQLRSNMKGEFMNNILNVMRRSDDDGDMKIDPEEVDGLVAKLNDISGGTLVEDRFRAIIAESDGSMRSVLKLIRSVMRADTPEDEQIFILDN